ncbi:PREDICTED: guanine nucleotide-binding protein subunit beta-like protein 1 [Dufourea novaeangliae]|uniref:Guanine nucleotide-binding protein subunit beta-like protein 1 n=1 Tax=Dufourea novaeangliae TaxID=178035 RepID=A0A154PQL3_DUFNO|nr:PREDICTED: guanine nucleotide-binding protein subunit beta-like protein 1 [Dufourea novaeangliae]KZC14205.1 Guanine nucleotide-binding protein subunit beta-like protein 1 [Dufourea novaeangliae]
MAMLPPDPIYVFRSDMGSVHTILFEVTSNIEHLYAGTATGNVHIWDLKTNREKGQIKSGQECCISLQSLDKEDLFVQHKYGLIKAYKKCESQWNEYKSIVVDFYHYCRFQTLSQKELLVPLKESKVGILSTDTFNVELQLSPINFENLGEVMVMKSLTNKNLVLVGYECGKLILWDVRQRKTLNYLTIEPYPMALDFDSTLMKGIIAGPSDQLQVFTLLDNHILCDQTKITLTNSGTSVITIRPDIKIVAIGGWDNRVRIYAWKNLKPLAVLNQHRDTVQDIAYSLNTVKTYDDKCLMATAAKDGYIALWNIYN